MATFEKHLGTLAGDEPRTRVEVVQVAEPGETPTVELRMQRHGDSIGWTTHRRIRLAAGQVGQLTSALNLMDPDARDADHTGDSIFDVVQGGQDADRSSG